MALKTELGDDGLSLWKYHSDLNSAKYDEKEHDRKWKSFTRTDITMVTVVRWAITDTTRQAITFAQMIQEHEEDYGSENDNIEIDDEDVLFQIRSMNKLVRNVSIFKIFIPPIYQKGRYFAEIGNLMAQKVTYEQVMELMREICACPHSFQWAILSDGVLQGRKCVHGPKELLPDFGLRDLKHCKVARRLCCCKTCLCHWLRWRTCCAWAVLLQQI